MPRGIPRTSAAKDHPVFISQDDTSQMDINQGAERLMKSTGPASESFAPGQIIRVADRPLDGEKMAMLQFMNEMVEIKMSTTTDKNAAQCFEINVNGHLEFFRRGETKTVKRFIVDRLLRLKETVYTQKEVVNSEGIKEYLHVPHTGLKYDFAISRDDNPLGRSWERAILAEPG